MMKTKLLIAIFGLFICSAAVAERKSWQSLECGTDWGPINQVAPTYPRRAQMRGVEGFIIMSFSINTDGVVEDIAVVDAEPATTFVRTATRAVEAFKFPPCEVNGVAIKQTDISIKYDFNFAS